MDDLLGKAESESGVGRQVGGRRSLPALGEVLFPADGATAGAGSADEDSQWALEYSESVPSPDPEVEDARNRELEQLRERLHLAEMIALRAQAEKGDLQRRKVELEQRLEQGEAQTKAQTAEVERLTGQLESARKVLESAKAQVDRARADMEQQRRRFARESEELRNTAEDRVMRELLPSLDNFALAFETFEKNGDADGFVEGMRMVHRSMMLSLAQAGLERVNPVGDPFDPNLHDAASVMQDAELPDGAVGVVMRAGYTLRGRVLRPAMVAVNKLPPPPPSLPSPMGPTIQEMLDEMPETDFPPPNTSAPPEEMDPDAASTRVSPPRRPIEDAWKFLETRFDD